MVRNKHPENWVNSQGQGQGHDDITLIKIKNLKLDIFSLSFMI